MSKSTSVWLVAAAIVPLVALWNALWQSTHMIVDPRTDHVWGFSPDLLPRQLSRQLSNETDSAIHLRNTLRNTITTTSIHPTRVFTQADADRILSKIAASRQELQNFDERYFVYTEKEITQPRARRAIRKGNRGKKGWRTRFGAELAAELDIIEAIERHKLRTDNATAASQFFIPMPVGSMITAYPKPNGDFPRAFRKLYNHPLFADTQGHKHIILGQAVPLFSRTHFSRMARTGLPQHYRNLWNITVATDMDARGVELLRTTHSNASCSGDFEDSWKKTEHHLPVVKSTFSLNFIPTKESPYQETTYESFQQKELFLFYRSRTDPSLHNSTQYRHAPFNETVIANLPNSSIGTDIPADQYLSDLKNSKFCLNIRGDNPQSHALLRSVQVGCIPVVVANCLALFSPTFKTSLDLYDYAVVLDEQRFLKDPLKELQSLQQMSELEIQTKLAALRFTQRVIMPHHPQSLFVPAFLREAKVARQESRDRTEALVWLE